MTPNLQPMSWWCRFGFHRWSTWGDAAEAPQSHYSYQYQRRTCLRCGRVHERQV